MRVEAFQEQEKELKSNFQRLSLERRAQVVMLSRKLVEEEECDLLDWNFFKRKLVDVWIITGAILFSISLAKLLFGFPS